MRIPHSPRRRLLGTSFVLSMLLPGAAGIADDVDLFRTSVAPNVLLYVDNSSSMMNQVYHPDWEGKTAGTKNKKQKVCEYFRHPYHATDHPTGGLDLNDRFNVYNRLKSATYQNTAGNTQRFRSKRSSRKAWEIYPIKDPQGNAMFWDKDLDGVQNTDLGDDTLDEPPMFHRLKSPTSSIVNWNRDTGLDGGIAEPVLDYDGTHLFYDADGNGVYDQAADPNDRLLYYERKSSGTGGLHGQLAKIATFIQPVGKAIEAGIDLETLEFAAGTTICGVDASGYSLYDNTDPDAGEKSGKTVILKDQYLDFLFSSPHGDQARVDTLDIARDYDLSDASGVTETGGKRAKASCITQLTDSNGNLESSYYFTFRRSRAQALQQVMRAIVCRVNEQTDHGVRFGFAQFRFHGKAGDDNGAYVAVPIMDWYSDQANGTLNSYTLHGVTATHEEHLQQVITRTTPDAQTPLNEGLFQLYSYFMSRDTDMLPYGRDWKGQLRDGVELSPAEKFPVYNYDMSLYDPLDDPMFDASKTPPSSLYNVGGLFMGLDPADQSEDANVPASNATVFDGFAAPDPMQYPCQKSFILLITDGASAGDEFDDRDAEILASSLGTSNNLPVDFDTATDIGYDRFYDLIGDHFRLPDPDDPDSATGIKDENKDEASTTGGSRNLLDDIALFMNRYDFRPDENDMSGKQTIDMYTVGYSLATTQDDIEGGAEDDLVGSALQKAAIRGNGSYFESSDANQLENDLVKAIADMVDKAQAFTSATVPASRTTDGNNFYSSFFLPKDNTGFWEGHLKNFDFSAHGDILTSEGFCATGDQGNIAPNPTCQSGGALRIFSQAFWDAADSMPAPLSRKLFAELPTDTMFSPPSNFDATDLAFSDFGIVDGVDETYPPYSTAGLTDEADIASALIENVRGCEFNSSPCVPRVNDAGDNIYLGDIFHSNPVVVGSPNAPVNESAYHDFATDANIRQRTRVIYAGANDGFLHGFNAGNWQTKVLDGNGNPTTVDLIPPRHGRGTGEELMGFMPWWIRNTIKELPKQTSFPRDWTGVDASPIVSDAWFYRAVSGGNLGSVDASMTIADKLKEQWRTVLIGGLRDGGRNYYALDVTEPTAAASDVSTEYPRYLWSFPCEGSSVACTGFGRFPANRVFWHYMGLTWSEPVITRVRVAVDNGYIGGHERWVAIFGAGYDPSGDPNQKRNVLTPAYDPSATAGRAIFMVDITTGEVLAMKYFDEDDEYIDGEQIGYKQMQYAFASAPAVFDIDFDGFADVVYIGDLGGNLWKWVVSSIGHDPINNGVASPNANIAQPNWPFRLYFRGSPSAAPPERLTPPQAYDPSIHYQSFFFPPTGVLRNGKLVLAFGAGERAEPIGLDSMFDDTLDTNNNHYYVIKDVDPYHVSQSASVLASDALGEADLADFDSNAPLSCDQMKATKQGYFLTGRDAEKFITNSVVFLGTVFTGSFIPPDPNNITALCEASGTAFLYSFDLECGVGKFVDESGTAADKRRKAIGDGIPTRPRVSVGDLNQGGESGGCKNKVVVITSDGNISNDCPGTISGQGIKVRSWRER